MNPRGRPSRPLADRFWEKVDKSGDCWLWTAGRFRNGYGQIKVNNRTSHAHRIAWELVHGPIPAGMFVCHDCPSGDDKHCVRPDHLFLGSAGDNTRDAGEKGLLATGNRNGAYTKPERRPRGDRHGWKLHPESLANRPMPWRKLDHARASEIRARYHAGERPKKLAAEYGVSTALIHAVVVGRVWSQPVSGG